MEALFQFDEGDHFARTSAETASSAESRESTFVQMVRSSSPATLERWSEFAYHIHNNVSDCAIVEEDEETCSQTCGESAACIDDEDAINYSFKQQLEGVAQSRDEAEFEEQPLVLDHDFVSDQAPAVQSRTRMTSNDFEPLRILGKGAFGTVLLVRHKASNRLFAQKQLKKASIVIRKKHIEYTRTERSILEEVRNPFVVRLFYAFQDHETLNLILEYAAGGELFFHLANDKMFSEQVASFYIAEAYLGLSALHEKGILYRDLKAENLLLNAEGHLLLTDFGLSKLPMDNRECRSFAGTCEYMAPEIIMERPYSFAVDYWSLGILMYDLLTGSPPYTGNNQKIIGDKIVKSKLTLSYYLSQDAKDLVTKLLKKNPAARLGSREGDDRKIRSHRFFRNWNWSELEARSCEPPIRPVITDESLAENFNSSFTSMPIPKPSNVTNFEDSKCSPFPGFTYIASFVDDHCMAKHLTDVKRRS